MGRENNSFTGFFFLLVSKKNTKKQKKTTNLYTWRKSAHGHLYLALILQRSEQHYFSFFCLSSLWKLTKWARPHSSICDRRFSLLKFVSSHSVWIKVFHRRQSLCEAQRKPLKRSFLLVAPEPRSLFWKASCFLHFGATPTTLSKPARHTPNCVVRVKGQQNAPTEGRETDTGPLCDLGEKVEYPEFRLLMFLKGASRPFQFVRLSTDFFDFLLLVLSFRIKAQNLFSLLYCIFVELFSF